MRVVTDFAAKWLLIALAGGGLVIGIWLSITGSFWSATPERFEPQIKISLLARYQAQSLEGSAERYEAGGEFEKARRTWWLAARKNPGNPKYFRRYLTSLRRTKVSPGDGKRVISHGHWLLRLTQGKSEDVEVFFGALEHCRRYQEILSLYSRFERNLASEFRAFQLRAYFHVGQYDQFQELWNHNPKQFDHDPLMTIYRLGVDALLKPSDPAFEALKKAYEAVDPFDSRYLQSRSIALRVYARWGDVIKSRRILTDLSKRRVATLPDYVAYWQLQIWLGRDDLVASEFNRADEPMSPFETRLLTHILVMAGLQDRCLSVFENGLTVFGKASLPLWLEYGELLVQRRSWHRLNALAQEAYDNDDFESLRPLAKYWEGLAAWTARKKDKASDLFSEIPEIVRESASDRFDLAVKLHALGQEEIVHKLIAGPDGKVDDFKTYWLLRTASATRRRDSAARGEVTSVAFRFDPDSIPYIHNYLGTLLLRGDEPVLALELATKLLEADPRSSLFRLKYGRALLLNQRFDEAERFLRGIDLFELDIGLAVPELHYAIFQLAVGQDRKQLALRHARMLDLGNYMPEEWEIIEEFMAQSTE